MVQLVEIKLNELNTVPFWGWTLLSCRVALLVGSLLVAVIQVFQF